MKIHSDNSINYISINKDLININYIPKKFKTFDDIITNLNIIIQLQNTQNQVNNNYTKNISNTTPNTTPINYTPQHKTYNNYKNYYILNNNHLINKNESISNYINNHNQINISNTTILYLTICERQKGGNILDMFKTISKLGTFFGMIYKFLLWLVKFLLWFIQFLLWLFLDLLNPITLLTDFFNSLLTIVIAICRLPYDIFMALFSLSVNTLGGWMQGFWGWDQSSLTQYDKESNYFKHMNKNKGKKCYLTNTNTVPFSILLGTILCPPIGVFMDMGLTGWLNVLICILLTLLFYIPGLVYALLIIYS